MSMLFESIPKFRECAVISNVPKKGFVPLYDRFNNFDFGLLSGTDADPPEIKDFVGTFQLCKAWDIAGHDVYINHIQPALGYELHQAYPSMSGFTALIQLYCFRHSLEMSMKAILNLQSVKYRYKDHGLKYLFEEVLKTGILDRFVKEYKNHADNIEQVSKFVYWLDSIEVGENSYRYFLSGKNKLLLCDQYIDPSRIHLYVMYFQQVIEACAWIHIKSIPEWNKDVIRCSYVCPGVCERPW